MIPDPIRSPIHDDMGSQSYIILFFAVILQGMNVLLPSTVEAITRWNGSFSLGDTYAENPEGKTNLFQGAINLDIKPSTKKRLDSRFNIRVNFTDSDKESIWNVSPIGNLGVDVRGERYSVNVKHSNYANITTTADLVETQISRAALTLEPENLPRIVSSYSTTTTGSDGAETQSDTFSFFSDYRYKWMDFRGGYSKHERSSEGQKSSTSDSLYFGAGGSYEVLPRTMLSGNFEINYDTNNSSSGFKSTTESRVFRISANSRPLEWFSLDGNFNKD
ncbi:MAG: hypothetical protein H8E41_00015, partial [Desulfobulbaceae bacterium]|nr:hypothetical protein [Candidatus Desulfobia pelagia]